MRGFVALLLLSGPQVAFSQTDAELLNDALQHYRAGLELRGDSERALPQFLHAATQCDALWDRGIRNLSLARLRGQAYFLAGKLGHAIRAYREGLRASPTHRELATDLIHVRESITFSNSGNLASQAKTTDSIADGIRISFEGSWPWLLLFYAGGCAALVRWRMRHQTSFAWLGGVLIVSACAIAVGIWLAERRFAQEAARHVAVVDDPGSALFSGNGEHYSKKLDRLPPGVEVEVLATRGSWHQVQLSGGMIGWLPASVLLEIGGEDTRR